MSNKSGMCAACGSWAGRGQWVEDEDGRWWVCSTKPDCSEGAVRLDPQPAEPE